MSVVAIASAAGTFIRSPHTYSWICEDEEERKDTCRKIVSVFFFLFSLLRWKVKKRGRIRGCWGEKKERATTVGNACVPTRGSVNPASYAIVAYRG